MRRRSFLFSAAAVSTVSGCIDLSDIRSDGRTVESSVGRRIAGDNFHLVVESAHTVDVVGEERSADAGNHFLIINLVLKNVSGRFLETQSMLEQAEVESEGVSYSQSSDLMDPLLFNKGEMVPGELEKSLMIFEIPKDLEKPTLRLHFDPSIFGGIERVEVALEEEDEVHQLTQDIDTATAADGGAVQQDGVLVEILKIGTSTSLGPIKDAEEDHEFISVEVSIKNNTKNELRLLPRYQMGLKDGNGRSYRVTLKVWYDKPFQTPFVPGEGRAGVLFYEVKEGTRPLFWFFDFSFWVDGNKTIWKVREIQR